MLNIDTSLAGLLRLLLFVETAGHVIAPVLSAVDFEVMCTGYIDEWVDGN